MVKHIIQRGDIVYCHSDGRFVVDEKTFGDTIKGEQFCSRGKIYKIISVSRDSYYITNDRGASHCFIKKHLLKGDSKWFTLNKRFVLLEKV